MIDLKSIKSQEDLESVVRMRNLKYAADSGMVELDLILKKLTETFKPNIFSIEDAE